MAGDAPACDVFVSNRGPEAKRSLVSHTQQKLRCLNVDVLTDHALENSAEAWQATLASLSCCRQALSTPAGAWRSCA